MPEWPLLLSKQFLDTAFIACLSKSFARDRKVLKKPPLSGELIEAEREGEW